MKRLQSPSGYNFIANERRNRSTKFQCALSVQILVGNRCWSTVQRLMLFILVVLILLMEVWLC